MTTPASAAQPVQRDVIGIGFVLLSGLGVVFLPTTAKLAYLDGSNVLTVAFTRGVIGIVLLAMVALIMRQSLKSTSPLRRRCVQSAVFSVVRFWFAAVVATLFLRRVALVTGLACI